MSDDYETVFMALNELNNMTPEMKPNDGVKQKLFKSISPQSRFDGFSDRLCKMFDLPRTRIEQLLHAARLAPQVPWQPMAIENVFLLHFDGGPKTQGADCGLVYLAPHIEFPNHQHLGSEVSLILQGDLQESNGKIWQTGDQVFLPPRSEHAIKSLGNEPAIFAVVIHSGIEFLSGTLRKKP